jgi:RNA polymerase sigma-70 factor (ECF subfamily)
VAATDGEIVARVLGGDAEAYAVLFQRHGRLVHALALARTTRAAAASEITRKAFEKAYADLERMPPDASVRQFLQAATAEACSSYQRDHGRSMQILRAGRREARKAGAGLDLRWVFAGLRPEDAALVVLEVASRLPPQYEVPFLLRHLEGMAPAEIAEATGASPAEVRTSLDSGRRLFERELKHALEGAA